MCSMPPALPGSMLYFSWHRQVTSSEMHSVHVSAVWFLELTLARINGWGEDLGFVVDYGFLRTIECIRFKLKPSGLRPRDVSRPPVGSSSDVNTTRQIQSPSSASGTFFNCIQVSLSAPGGQAHVLLYQIVGDAWAGCWCHQYQYIFSSNGFWPRRTRTILRSATITPHQRQD